METKFIILLASVMIIPWAVLWVVYSSTGRNIKKYFRKLEEKYSLSCDYSKKVGLKSYPQASGVYRNRQIKIESLVLDSIDGKKVIPHTQLTVQCSNPGNFFFLIARRNRRNNALFVAGSSLVDDNEFDDRFIVQTNDITRLRKMLDFNLKFKLEQIYYLGFDGLIKLEGDIFRYSEKGLLDSENSLLKLELILHEICDISDVLKYQ